MRPALAVVFVLLGCGRSDVVDDAPALAAPSPAPITTCTSTCTTSPPGVDTPLQTTDDGKPLHWAT